MKTKEVFSINPGTAMIDVLGHSGYTFNFAIADLIDNCIAANAKNITLYFDLKSDNPYLYLIDDGDGMSLEKLKEAAIIGFKDIDEFRAEDDLGRYSTGLKSATRSFCDAITISSKEKMSKPNSIKIDYSYIVKNKKWEAFIIENFEHSKKLSESGTIIFCEKINFLKVGFEHGTIYEKLEDLQKSLSHIFGKFLLSNQINIFIQTNGSKPIKVEGWNPFSLLENKTTKLIFEKEHIYFDSVINIKAYIMPVFSNLTEKDKQYMIGRGLLEQSGFYIYRNKRLIQEGGWLNLDHIGLDDKSKYARIEVEIPSKLDRLFQINFSKNSLVIPDQLKPLFIEIAKKARSESRNNYDYKKHPELKKTLKKHNEKIWKTSKTNNGVVLSINMEHPLIKELSNEVPSNTLKNLINLITKSLPIAMIQSQETSTSNFTENELFEMMEKTHKKFLDEGLNLIDIKRKMVSLEPFKDYKSVLAEYFDKIGG